MDEENYEVESNAFTELLVQELQINDILEEIEKEQQNRWRKERRNE